MEKENIKTVTIEDFKNSQHILDYIDDDFAIVNSLDGIPYSNEVHTTGYQQPDLPATAGRLTARPSQHHYRAYNDES